MITLTPFERLLHSTLVSHIRTTAQSQPRVHVNPDWICITPKALASQLRVLKDDGSTTARARGGNARTAYIEPGLDRLTPAIAHVSMYEFEHGRPLLGTLVVTDAGAPNLDALAPLARHLRLPVEPDSIDRFWTQQIDELIRFWATEDLVLVIDSAVDRLATELADIKALVRKLANAKKLS
jgi:hypothetical protein